MRKEIKPRIWSRDEIEPALCAVPHFELRSEKEQRYIRDAYNCFIDTTVGQVRVYRHFALVDHGIVRYWLKIDGIDAGIPADARLVGMATRAGTWYEPSVVEVHG